MAAVSRDHKACWRELGLKVGAKQELSAHVTIGDFGADEREQLLFVFFILQKATVPFSLRDFGSSIPDSCPWSITTSLLSENFEIIFLCVIIQYDVHSLDIILHMGLPIR